MSGAADISPAELAELVVPHLDTALVAFDIDGVLAPLVDDDARLATGVAAGLATLAELTAVAIVSGRTVERLDRLFGLPDGVHVIGSHGLEERGTPVPTLDDDEQYTFEQLEIIATRGVDAAGDGAWLEYTPTSVVLHTRGADDRLAEPAIEAVTNLGRMIDGARVKPGSDGVELLARSTSKVDAVIQLARRLDRSPVVYVGDDGTDEDAVRRMDDVDISVHVGPGETAAHHRLRGPDAVADYLSALTTAAPSR